ncbi:MAG: hypothetical protein AAF402_06710 [Pseudomonadota bacterium]
MKKTLVKFIFASGLLIASWLTPPTAFAGSSASSSLLLSQATAIVVSGVLPAVSSQLVVDSVSTVGESTYVVLKSIPDSIETSIKVTGSVVGAASLAAGQSIQAVTHVAGIVLTKAGEVVAFIPNEIGKSLMEQSRH